MALKLSGANYYWKCPTCGEEFPSSGESLFANKPGWPEHEYTTGHRVIPIIVEEKPKFLSLSQL